MNRNRSLNESGWTLSKNNRLIRVFIASGAMFGLTGVIARSLSSHKLKPLLNERNTLDNFNLGADYLVIHGLALIIVAVLMHLLPAGRFHRAGFSFILGSVLFQYSVLLKSFISIHPFGFLTPLGGLFLMLGWGLLALYGCTYCNTDK